VDSAINIDVQVYNPDATGAKSITSGSNNAVGMATPTAPLVLQFAAPSEGYFQLMGKLTNPGDAPVRAYFKVQYQGPTASALF
jgi:hypothetical protein